MENALTPVSQVEVLRPLAQHAVVRCPDDSIGEVAWSSCSEVHVIHADRSLGRGPWIFARHQVDIELHAPTVAEYRHRAACLALGIEVSP